VVGEAMACGAPVVATDVGDTGAIVGAHGEVVPPGRPDLMSAGWARLRRRLAENPDLRTVARDAIVTSYGLDAMVQRTEAVLSQLVAGRPAGDIAHEFA
jgi:glycosyltransferase involved in cell wall biosynthesis